jgi:hypothetical protein
VPCFSFIFRSTALTPFRYAHSRRQTTNKISPRKARRTRRREINKRKPATGKVNFGYESTSPTACLESYVPSLAIFVSFVVQDILFVTWQTSCTRYTSTEVSFLFALLCPVLPLASYLSMAENRQAFASSRKIKTFPFSVPYSELRVFSRPLATFAQARQEGVRFQSSAISPLYRPRQVQNKRLAALRKLLKPRSFS